MRRVLTTAVILAAFVAVGLVPSGHLVENWTGPGLAQAQDLTARLAAIETKLVKVDALEARVAALEARQAATAAPVYLPAPVAPAAPDLMTLLTPILNGAVAIQAHKHLFKLLDDRPRGFLASLTGDDSGFMGAFLPLIVTLKAIGTPLGLGF